LTRREGEIVRLVAGGLTNRQDRWGAGDQREDGRVAHVPHPGQARPVIPRPPRRLGGKRARWPYRDVNS